MKPTSYLGVDPGEAWIGLAVLQCIDSEWRGSSVTIDRRKHGLIGAIKMLSPYVREAQSVVAEDYDVRPQGFNAFSDGQTLRLLGALELECSRRSASFAMVSPDRPEKARLLWPSVPVEMLSLTGNREHATSAWRVLGQYLLKRDVHLLQTFNGARL